jgi:hypothetical protein
MTDNSVDALDGPVPFRAPRGVDWLPLLVLPSLVIALRNDIAPWVCTWALAGAIFISCKWLTFTRAIASGFEPVLSRALAHFFAWPGMDASEFLGRTSPAPGKIPAREWLFGCLKTLAGAALLSFASHGAFGGNPLIAGWVGMVGIILLLHFGLFDLLALAWRRGGVNVTGVMRQPMAARSLSEFWGKRWNTAFNALARDLAFRPMSRKLSVPQNTLAVFLLSGIVHDLVISLPARGGFGLPTAYFLFQGVAVLVERSSMGRRFGLGKGFRGWLFTLLCTAGPAFWLFHPPFVMNVILPMLHAIGTN